MIYAVSDEELTTKRYQTANVSADEICFWVPGDDVGQLLQN